MALSQQSNDAQPYQTKDLPKPATALTNLPDWFTLVRSRSAALGTEEVMLTCPLISSTTGDEWTFKCPPTVVRTSSLDRFESWGIARSSLEQESMLMSQNMWSPYTSHQTTHSDLLPPYLSGSWNYSKLE